MLNIAATERRAATTEAAVIHGKVAVVIPAYNEAETVAEVVADVLRYVPDVIVVDDGSTDGTTEALDRLAVRVIRHRENRGKAASLRSGFDAALRGGASAVITLDADLQHRPGDLPRFLACAGANPDHVVVGSRLADQGAFPTLRYHANRTANFWISWASGVRFEDSQCGYRVYPRRVLEAVRVRHGAKRSFVFESEILIEAARAGFRFKAVRIPAIYGSEAARHSHFRPVLDIARIVRMVAWKLLSRAMYPQGLYRSMRRHRPPAAAPRKMETSKTQ